jgi:hypothetical protein
MENHPHGGTPEQYLPTEKLEESSENIAVGGTTLRELYTARRITEGGLRRIVHEHLRGGNVEQALKEELLKEETKYERDPQLHKTPDTYDGPPANNTIETMAEEAMQGGLNPNAPPSHSERKAVSSRTPRPAPRPPRRRKTSRPADAALMIIIAVLAIIALVIWLTR